MQYLTNHDPKGYSLLKIADVSHDVMAFRVYVAALRSGQNVKYLTCPMPALHDECDSYYCNNVASGAFNHFGCIVGIDNEFDYSQFWREMDKLENRDEA